MLSFECLGSSPFPINFCCGGLDMRSSLPISTISTYHYCTNNQLIIKLLFLRMLEMYMLTLIDQTLIRLIYTWFLLKFSIPIICVITYVTTYNGREYSLITSLRYSGGGKVTRHSHACESISSKSMDLFILRVKKIKQENYLGFA